MKTKQRILGMFALMLVIPLALGLVACGKDKNTDDDKKTTTNNYTLADYRAGLKTATDIFLDENGNVRTASFGGQPEIVRTGAVRTADTSAMANMRIDVTMGPVAMPEQSAKGVVIAYGNAILNSVGDSSKTAQTATVCSKEDNAFYTYTHNGSAYVREQYNANTTHDGNYIDPMNNLKKVGWAYETMDEQYFTKSGNVYTLKAESVTAYFALEFWGGESYGDDKAVTMTLNADGTMTWKMTYTQGELQIQFVYLYTLGGQSSVTPTNIAQ